VANSVQATKRAQQSARLAQANASKRSAVRTAIKKTLKLILAKKGEEASVAYRETARLIDKLANHRGIIHPNKAARLKSRLHKKVKDLSQPA
jgi:small subunit ribosomal protein S20